MTGSRERRCGSNEEVTEEGCQDMDGSWNESIMGTAHGRCSGDTCGEADGDGLVTLSYDFGELLPVGFSFPTHPLLPKVFKEV